MGIDQFPCLIRSPGSFATLPEQEVKVFRTPSPPPRPSPTEIALPDTFTVDQMRLLHQQFMCSAPSGFISNKGFVDTLSDMTALTVSRFFFWKRDSPKTLELIGGLFAIFK